MRHAPFDVRSQERRHSAKGTPDLASTRGSCSSVSSRIRRYTESRSRIHRSCQLSVAGRVAALLALEANFPIRMHPFEMHGIDRVFLALQPIARDLREHDLGETVGPAEWLPFREQRRRQRPQVGPQHPRLGLERERPAAGSCPGSGRPGLTVSSEGLCKTSGRLRRRASHDKLQRSPCCSTYP